jgi:hypothetical protein
MLTSLVLFLSAASADKPFEIQVVDDQSGRGVPLVELTTTAGVTFVTDSAGRIAFDEPGQMNQRVWFAVKSHGYEAPKDGFGIAGAAFDVTPAGKGMLKIKRLNIAERLYRITGSGIYRDSVLLGHETPLKEPLLNAKVTGCDSVLLANYRDKLYWFWGDTNRPAYILGLYEVPGATSATPASGLDIEKGIDLTYFTGKDGFVRATCKMAGEGPTWIGGVTTVKDAKKQERLVGSYMKVKAPLSIYRRGTCVWNDEKNEFEHAAEIPLDAPLFPHGHPILFNDCGVVFAYFGDPFFNCRVYATPAAYSDLSLYEAFTCLKNGSTLDKPEVERDASGNVVWAFKRNTAPVDAAAEAKLLKTGLLKPEEANFQIRDAKTGKSVAVHRGSVRWNDYRKQWVCIFGEYGGKSSFIGEIWYAEANMPTGPWTTAVKVVTHDKYSLYNPVHHSEFDREGGRFIYFEGTYTHTFSGNEHKTPRYDYNQVLYKLDLADERLQAK